MWWALAPIGLVVIVEWVGNKRAWKIKDASQIFLWAIVGLAVLFTSYVVIGKLVNLNDGRNIWSKEYFLYKKVDILIASSFKQPNRDCRKSTWILFGYR